MKSQLFIARSGKVQQLHAHGLSLPDLTLRKLIVVALTDKLESETLGDKKFSNF